MFAAKGRYNVHPAAGPETETSLQILGFIRNCSKSIIHGGYMTAALKQIEEYLKITHRS